MIGLKLIRSIRKRIAFIKPLKRAVVDGITYDLDCRETIDLHIYYGGWEASTIAVIRKYVQPGHVVLEVGGNVGAHTLTLAQEVGPNGYVHSIEPTDFARNKLMQNIRLNPEMADRITVHNYLITNEHDPEPRRQIQASWSASHSITQRPDENVVSPTISLDDLAEEAKILRCDFMKIDIDGYDLKAIQGAKHLLTRDSPTIFIELFDAALRENGATLEELVSTLNSFGYSGVDVDTGQEINNSYLASLSPSASRNGIFIKK